MKIIGCEVFRTEVEHLLAGKSQDALWLSPGLHVDLQRLKATLEQTIEGNHGVVCFYGGCHPQIDEVLEAHGGCRFPGKDCVAAFLGEEERRELEGRKAFVMTPGWLRHWREIFQEGLHWDEVDARQNFGFYDSIVLLDFGIEPIDDLQVLEFFDYTQKPVEIVPATLDRFRDQLADLTASSPGD